MFGDDDDIVEYNGEYVMSDSFDRFMGVCLANYLETVDPVVFGPSTMRKIREYATGFPAFDTEFDRLEEECKKSKGKDWVLTFDFITKETYPELIRILLHDIFTDENGQEITDRSFHIYNCIGYLSDMLELCDEERIILQFYHHISSGEMGYGWKEIITDIQQRSDNLVDFFVRCFKFNRDRIKDIIEGDGLFASGLLEPHDQVKNHFRIIPSINKLLSPETILTDEVIEHQLFPSELTTDLDLADFHQQEDIKIATDVINNGIRDGHTGINILMWGLPGMGKTELSILLSKLEGWELKVIGDIGRTDGKEKTRSERLLALNIAQRLYRNRTERKIVLLFDEMEDLFKTDNNASQSKAFINRIIEKTPVPIMWTTNDMEALGSAVLRRMTFNIPFNRVPPAKVRKAIWNKYVTKYGLTFSRATIDHIATNFDVVPALIANICKVAHLSNIDETKIPRVLKNLDTAMHLGNERDFTDEPQVSPKKFQIQFVNTNLNLINLRDRIMSRGATNFSILSYGPSGTGKSAFGVYLAEQMGLRHKIWKASDLLSKWVGGTEKKIARMFEEARDDDLFTILDEGDSFLQDRNGAHHSWEVTQVNEMLVQMERHGLPFMCTTNLEKFIDPAAFRRFTFKIKYDYSTEEQRSGLYQYYFDRPAPSELNLMTQLTPGDFKNVFDKMDFLGEMADAEIMQYLQEEEEIKPSFRKRIGV